MSEGATSPAKPRSGPAMPIKIDDVDAGWLTAALASRIWAGAEVQSFSVATIGTGVGLMGLPVDDRVRR